VNLPAARIGFFVVLSVIAVAAVASGVVLSRKSDPSESALEDARLACWGASAG